jgi:hypothetical protein
MDNMVMVVVDAVLGAAEEQSLGVPEDLRDNFEILFGQFTDAFHHVEFQVYFHCAGWTSHVLMWAVKRIREEKRGLDSAVTVKTYDKRREYRDATGKPLTLSEARGKIMTSRSMQKKQEIIDGLEYLKDAARAMQDLLRTRKDFILEVSRNRRTEEYLAK